jgi:hypothetical protein
MLVLAGRAAERFLTRRWNHTNASADYHAAVGYASYVCRSDKEVTAYPKWLDLRAQELVTLWQHAIRAAARLWSKDDIYRGSKQESLSKQL